VELRNALQGVPDLEVVWVMAKRQIDGRSLRFIDEYGLRRSMHFWADPGSRAIDQLGIRRPNPEPLEVGVPHPTTLLVDREGIVRFADVRENYQIWLDPAVLLQRIAALH